MMKRLKTWLEWQKPRHKRMRALAQQVGLSPVPGEGVDAFLYRVMDALTHTLPIYTHSSDEEYYERAMIDLAMSIAFGNDEQAFEASQQVAHFARKCASAEYR